MEKTTVLNHMQAEMMNWCSHFKRISGKVGIFWADGNHKFVTNFHMVHFSFCGFTEANPVEVHPLYYNCLMVVLKKLFLEYIVFHYERILLKLDNVNCETRQVNLVDY